MPKTDKTKKAEEKETQNVEQTEQNVEDGNVVPQESETVGDGVPQKKESETEKLKDQLLRAMAEYDNYRKRTARERIELEADIKAKVVIEFLPMLDNLERALQADCKDENYKKGIELIKSSFLETLKNLGVEEITEEDFDPAVHQAVQHVEDEKLESGKVAQVFQKGYKIGNKIIRFAMVSIVK
ncbi:MAG: nucleotide exchange factor GrpE [Oscillospiraceae bacterium]|nr:nucleotide exchange factor GrpE [Oscillospiraceae bacterium]